MASITARVAAAAAASGLLLAAGSQAVAQQRLCPACMDSIELSPGKWNCLKGKVKATASSNARDVQYTYSPAQQCSVKMGSPFVRLGSDGTEIGVLTKAQAKCLDGKASEIEGALKPPKVSVRVNLVACQLE